MKETRDFILAYKLFWVRVLGYMLVPMITFFLAQTETFSGETWKNMDPFLKVRLMIACFLVGFSALMGVIDQSLQRAREKHQELKGDTQRWTKEQTKTDTAKTG